MRHSGNYAQTVADRYELGGVITKLYVYDELDRFVTVANLRLSRRDLEHFLSGIDEVRKEHEDRQQPKLPPWQD